MDWLYDINICELLSKIFCQQ